MRIQELLTRPLPVSTVQTSWDKLLTHAATGDHDAIAAAFGRRRGLAWCLVRQANSSGLEDPDAVLLEGIWRAIVRQCPTEEAFYSSIHSHLLSAIRRGRRRQIDSVSIDAVSAHLADGGPDPVGSATVDAVVARQVLDSIPADVVRAAADRLTGRADRISAADRQRLHRWRSRHADLLATAAA
ncbi:MAG: hypothetical protein ABMA25_15075 [Ilumatobacteraceae bacterium]